MAPPLLMYHWFRRDGETSHSRSPQLEITPSRFERQLLWLARHGWRTVSLEQVVRGADLPHKAVVLTVDDGTLDFWEHGRPVLERCGFHASLFVVTGHVGGTSAWDADVGEPARPLMSWAQIAELRAGGHEIGSHTHTHRPLPTLDPRAARDELARSRDTLAERLGRAPALLAYPRGQYRDEHRRMAREAGYLGACAVVLGWRDLRPAGPYALPRLTVKGTASMLAFRLRLALARRIRVVREPADAVPAG